MTTEKIIGTKEAFLKMISERGIYQVLDVRATTVRGWRMRLKEGKLISIDKMEEMLIKGGWKVVQEKIWNI